MFLTSGLTSLLGRIPSGWMDSIIARRISLLESFRRTHQSHFLPLGRLRSLRYKSDRRKWLFISRRIVTHAAARLVFSQKAFSITAGETQERERSALACHAVFCYYKAAQSRRDLHVWKWISSPQQWWSIYDLHPKLNPQDLNQISLSLGYNYKSRVKNSNTPPSVFIRQVYFQHK